MGSAVERLEDGSGFRVRVRDGRRVGVSIAGDAEGLPLLWLPGTPASRLWRVPDEAATRSLGVRVIVVERPGFGASDPKPGRRVVDTADDVRDVADALGIERFALAGSSGAGPYLTACGARLSDRITRLGYVNAMGPVDLRENLRALALWRRAVFPIASHAPALVRSIMRARGLGADPEAFYRMLTRDAPPSDRRVLDRIWAQQVAMTAEALRQGIDAFVWELHLASRPWGVRLEDVRTDTIVWHGEEDQAAPIAMGRTFAARIPRCRATFFRGEGHFLHYDRWPALLRELVMDHAMSM